MSLAVISTGIVLIAHGSRVEGANRDLLEIAANFRRRGLIHTVAAFLELAKPGIVEGGEQCVALGPSTVVLVPYFLSAGRHVRDDLEAARQELQRRHPQRRFLLAKQLGPHPLLEEIMLQRIDACIVESANEAD